MWALPNKTAEIRFLFNTMNVISLGFTYKLRIEFTSDILFVLIFHPKHANMENMTKLSKETSAGKQKDKISRSSSISISTMQLIYNLNMNTFLHVDIFYNIINDDNDPI